MNTLFSSLCTLHPDYSFVSRWRPPFVTELAAEDRCHLNGLAMADGRPSVVTVMALTDKAGAWREDRNRTGTVLDVGTGEIVTRGLAMPHSPRWHAGRLYVLNSGWARSRWSIRTRVAAIRSRTCPATPAGSPATATSPSSAFPVSGRPISSAGSRSPAITTS